MKKKDLVKTQPTSTLCASLHYTYICKSYHEPRPRRRSSVCERDSRADSHAKTAHHTLSWHRNAADFHSYKKPLNKW